MRSVVSPFKKISQKFKGGFWKAKMTAEPSPYSTYHLCQGWTLPGCTPPSGEVTSSPAILWAVVSLLLLMQSRLPSSDKVWGWEVFKYHEVLLSDIYLPFLHALPPSLPPSIHPSPPPSPTHTSHWSGKLSDKVALERLTRKCISSLSGNGGMIGSRWRLLPPIGLTAGFPKVTSWSFKKYWQPSCLLLLTCVAWVGSE